MITTIRQMEASMEDPRHRGSSQGQNDGLDISYPLNRCLQSLKEKHAQVSRAHKERFAQVKSTCRCHFRRSVHHPHSRTDIQQNLSRHSNPTRHISNLALSSSPSHPQDQTSPSRPHLTSHPRTSTSSTTSSPGSTRSTRGASQQSSPSQRTSSSYGQSSALRRPRRTAPLLSTTATPPSSLASMRRILHGSAPGWTSSIVRRRTGRSVCKT